MIVVDTNVLAYLYLPAEYLRQAEALLERDPEWAAPILWRSEFRNVLAGYLRRKMLTFEEVRNIQEDAEDLSSGHEYEVSSDRVFELVRDSDCSAYDCELVALAISLGVKLVTMDAKVLRAFPRQTVALTAA